jgi:Tfp pilus assembly protein PilN
MTSNQLGSRQAELDRAKQETQQAKQRSGALAGYANFAQIKETRIQSVKQVSSQRFDWERMMREVALVLPSEIWLLDMSASLAGDTETAGTSSAGEPGAPVNPAVGVTGCAREQNDVAVLMVRLRKLYRATDVQLEESAEQGVSEGGGGEGTAPAGGSGGGADSCPPKRFKFDVSVSFAPEPLSKEGARGDAVPSSLGGGS